MTSKQSTVLANITKLEADLAQEKIKLERWRKENVRRKHNYVPFVMELLKLLASKGEVAALRGVRVNRMCSLRMVADTNPHDYQANSTR